jgi:hypothetical protein
MYNELKRTWKEALVVKLKKKSVQHFAIGIEENHETQDVPFPDRDLSPVPTGAKSNVTVCVRKKRAD